MKQKTALSISVILLVIIFVVASVGSYFLIKYVQDYVHLPSGNNNNNNYVYNPDPSEYDFTQFASKEEYQAYLSMGESSGYYSSWGLGSLSLNSLAEDTFSDSAISPKSYGYESSPSPERYSETNVQVAGIDEADIVKTNGQEIFYSPDSYYLYDMPMIKMEEDMMSDSSVSDYAMENQTRIINAFPPEKMEEYDGIKENGDLLLSGDHLIIIGYDQVTAYDVSDAASPEKIWTINIDSDTSIQTARLYNNQIYLITNTYVYDYSCPYKLLEEDGDELYIECTDIYHPVQPLSGDVNYSILSIDPKDGSVDDQMTFVGTYDSTIYMSTNSIYVGYTIPGDFIDLYIGFIEENGDLFSDSVLEKIKKLSGYELSDNTKMMELETILSQYISSLDEDEELKLENEIENRMTDYAKEHNREMELTQINKININNFDVEAVGSVPGELLNQFSLDEYNDHLRVATTTGQSWWGFPFSLVSESVNDVYVLDDELKMTGNVLDLGVGETIYSVRFLGDIGYVVTFEQIDPFYVIDLSNPKNPIKQGELKIPGYSSYLHPIGENLVLGIGEEDGQVKVSLFDVSNPQDPIEKDKYTLKEYWSDISETHHAFLMDDKHEVFFLPGSQGGYVFSYAGDKLQLETAVNGLNPTRAVYIDDYLYIISDQEIVVLDENSWERVEEFRL